jgi:dTDP-4-dehydrorhamnose 3,5-epimerase
MRFRETPLHGAFVLEIEPHTDERGYFTRLWCAQEFEQHGLPTRLVQESLSRNLRRGTVRGMHTQLPPSQEGKLVSCVSGSVYDVIVDARPGSPTFLQHFGVELSAEAHNALYIPPNMLHGFQTLEDNTEVFYRMTDFHAPDLAFGARWNDPAFGIRWPIDSDLVMNERDRAYPDFSPAAYERSCSALVNASSEGRRS